MYFRMKYFPVSVVAHHLMLGPEACQAECLSLTPVERWLLYHTLLKLSTYPSQQMSLCPSQLCVAARWSWETPRHDEICFFVRLCLLLSPVFTSLQWHASCITNSMDWTIAAAWGRAWTHRWEAWPKGILLLSAEPLVGKIPSLGELGLFQGLEITSYTYLLKPLLAGF